MPDSAQTERDEPIVTLADKPWLRVKRFRRSGIAWVLSVGSQDGRRLNVSWHRKPAPAACDCDARSNAYTSREDKRLHCFDCDRLVPGA